MTQDDDLLGRAYDGRLMRRLLGFLRPYAGAVALALGAIVVGSLAALAQPWLMKQAIDLHIATGRSDGLSQLAVVYVTILLIAFGAEFVQTWTMQMAGQHVMRDMRLAMYRHLQRIDLRYYDTNPVGRVMTRVTSDVDAINELFTSGVVTIFGDVFTLLGILAVMFWLHWRLALVACFVLPLIGVVTQWFRHHVRQSYRTVRGLIARINAFLQEHLTGMATVQLFRREAEDFRRFDALDRAHRDANVDSIFYYAVFYPAVEVVSALALALIIWNGAGWVRGGTLTLGTLAAFLQYSQRFFRPISDMSEKFNVLQAAMASSERIFSLLDVPVRIASPDVPRTPTSPRGHIVFDHVWFAYGTSETSGEPDWVLRDVAFEVQPGERVGMVGATGSGKTTVINLLLRYYDVQRGAIRIDGVDIREWDLTALRALFGLVLQDVQLFAGTIADNIRLGDPRISDQEVRAAADAVGASGFIQALPGAFEARVAERGATLSVGQKQLLSFARALACQPRCLLLDEATSSVDTETEAAIEDALTRVAAGRTTIAIAHRLATIQRMDRILVLHRGELREQGTHQALIARGGLYRTLYDLQYASRAT